MVLSININFLTNLMYSKTVFWVTLIDNITLAIKFLKNLVTPLSLREAKVS